MKKQQYERQNLAGEMIVPLKMADLISGVLGCVGFFFVFQPAKIAQTFGLSSLLSAGASAGLSRLTHKRYVDIAYERSQKQIEASEGEIQVLTQQVNDLELQVENLANELTENSDLLERQVKAQLEDEKKFKGAIAQLLIQKAEADQELAQATSQVQTLVESQKQLLISLKATVQESLVEWSRRLQELVVSAKAKNINLEEKLSKIAEDANEKTAWYEAEIEKINLGDGGVGGCADELISLLHSIYDHYGLLRVQIINSLHIRGKQELMAAVKQLTEQYEELNAQDVVPRAELETILDNYKSRLQEFQTSYGEHAEATIRVAEALEQEVLGQDPLFEKVHFLLEQQIQQIQTLEGKLKQAEQIRLFEGASPWRDIANQVIMHFAGHEIICDASTMPIHEAASDIEFYIVPRTRIGMKLIEADLEKAAEALRIPLGVKSIKISLEGKNVKVKIPIRDKQSVEKERPEDVLNRSRDLWSMYVGSEYHTFIFAATQSGKTTLADELNAMMYQRLEGKVKFNAITLKMDGSRDAANKAQRFIKPRFMPSHEAYTDALCSVHDDIGNRNELLQVNPNKVFTREVYVWDEYGEHYRLSNDEQKRASKKAVISLLQTGAGLSSEIGMGLSLMLFAQNPYVSTLGLLRPDLANGCIVIVGEKNIRLFLDSASDNHGLSKTDIERLENELEIYQDASRIASDKAILESSLNEEDAAISVRRCPENYFSLIVPSKAGLKPIILYNPTPGQYTNALVQNLDTQPEQVAKPTCPDCKTTHVKKRGKQGDRYECLNKECSRQTFTWKG